MAIEGKPRKPADPNYVSGKQGKAWLGGIEQGPASFITFGGLALVAVVAILAAFFAIGVVVIDGGTLHWQGQYHFVKAITIGGLVLVSGIGAIAALAYSTGRLLAKWLKDSD